MNDNGLIMIFNTRVKYEINKTCPFSNPVIWKIFEF